MKLFRYIVLLTVISSLFAENSSKSQSAAIISHSTDMLFPVYDKALIGFIDSTGSFRMKPQFSILFNDSTTRYIEFTSWIKMPSVLPFHFREGKLILSQSEVYSLFKQGNHYSIINEAGQVERKMICEWAGDFFQGYAQVCQAKTFLGIKIGEKWGAIGLDGEMRIKPQFDYLGPFSEGLAVARKNQLFGFIDTSGAWQIPPKFQECQPFQEGLAAISVDGKWRYINKQGKQKIEIDADRVWAFTQGRARVSVKGKYGFIDTVGAYVVSPAFDFALDYQEGLSCVSKDSSGGYIDLNGEWVINLQYENVGSFSQGIAAVKVSGLWGYINRQNEMIIDPQYQLAFPFQGGLSIVWDNYQPIYINTSGEKISALYLDVSPNTNLLKRWFKSSRTI